MKKTTLTILSLLLINGLTCAQVYFRTGGGYAFPIATQSIGENDIAQDKYNGNTVTSTNTSENVSASYGSGIVVNIGGGFMVSEYLGLDLNVSYLMGKKYETKDVYYYDDGNFKGKDEQINTTNSSGIFITPSFVVTPGGANAPYARFGVVFGAPKLKQEQSYYYDLDGTTTQSRKSEYTGGVSAGFQGAIGMNWELGSSLKLFTEMNFTSMTYYPKEGTLTESTYNGVSNMGQLSVYAKEIDYVKKIDNTVAINTTKPRQELRESVPFSSLSLQVGIVFFMGGKDM